ncbi:unnamed protein product [Darwinula stevensoni]|uniref:Protein quiver n=1 Tax=Darwinula stevensoni TaxID=69355 RepID=A0A7R9AFJ2_9CRUS|nr:unnamed protein product [Darwinula stevensoni]CAG0903365.1 unnamed protein product [Darwinula stevensoni]
MKLLIFLGILALVGCGSALTCNQCHGGQCKDESNWIRADCMDVPFVEEFCISTWDKEGVLQASYCGIWNKEECHKIQGEMTTCYCNSDLCNTAALAQSTSSFLLLLLLLLATCKQLLFL